MRTRSIELFCLEEEIVELLIPVLEHYGLDFFFAARKGSDWKMKYVERGGMDFQGREFWLAPREQGVNYTLDNILGLIQIYLPAVQQETMLQGSISIKCDPSLDTYVSVFNAIKSKVYRSFRRGMWGENSVSGKRAFYRNIFFSHKVEAMAKAGYTFLPRFGDGNVFYYPSAD